MAQQSAQFRPVPPGVSSPAWFNVTTTVGAGPSGPYGAAAFDPLLGTSGGEIVSFGGCVSTCPTNATWLYDGSTWGRWLSGPFPPATAYALLDYDPVLRGVLMFGGTNSTNSSTAALSLQTWLFNGTGWSNLTGTPWGAQAPPGLLATMAWDPSLNGMLLVGGCTTGSCLAVSPKAWLQNSTGWHNVFSTPPGVALGAASMAWDPVDSAMLLFGGNASALHLSNETWLLHGSTWQNRTGTSGCTLCAYPAAREFALMTWDGQTRQIELFGGANSTTGLNYNDTWEFTSSTGWTLPPLNSPAPVPAQILGAMPVNSSVAAPILLPGLSGRCGTCLRASSWVLDASPTLSPLTALPAGPNPGVPVNVSGRSSANHPGSGPWLQCTVAFGDLNLSVVIVSFLPPATSWTCSAAHAYGAPGSYTATMSVRDFYGLSTGASTSVQVNGSLQLTLTLSPSIPEARSSIQFQVLASGGVAPYTAVWTFGDGGMATGLSAAHLYSQRGAYPLRVNVTDAMGTQASTSELLEVLPSLVGNAIASPLNTDAGLVVNFSGSASGGSGTYLSTLWRFGDGATENSLLATHVYGFRGSYSASFTVTDNLGFVSKTSMVIRVGAVLSVQLTATPSLPTVGGTVSFRANASGGTPPLLYEWLLGDGATSALPAPQHAYASARPYTVLLWVNDSVGASIERSFALSVYQNTSSSSPATPAWENPILWVATAAVVAAASLGVLLLRRRTPPRPPADPPMLADDR